MLTHPELLTVDEIGYLRVSRSGATLFFQLVKCRYERASTVLTLNEGFAESGDIFGGEVITAALIDLLLHHSHLVKIRGNSFWMHKHSDPWQGLRPDDE